MNFLVKNAKCKKNIYSLFALAIINSIVFGFKSSYLGFYADDPTFLLLLGEAISYEDLMRAMREYVPGRNLHILWQYALIKLAGGGTLKNLILLHYFQVIADVVISYTFFIFLRQIGLKPSVAFLATVFFVLFPNHGETHFWISALPMNLISTFLILLLMIISTFFLNGRFEESFSYKIFAMILYWLVYLAAIFTYDQLVPVAFGIITGLLYFIFLQNKEKLMLILFIWLSLFLAPIILIIFLKLLGNNGPTLLNPSALNIFYTFLYSIGIWIFVWVKIFFFPISAITPKLTIILSLLVACFSILMFYIFNKKEILNAGSINEDGKLHFGSKIIASRYLLYFGIIFFFLAYLPNYIWSISPRHNYLPSLGVAIIIAWFFNSVFCNFFSTKKIDFFTLLFLGFFLYSFSLLNMLEKNFWIESFLIRKNIYEKLVIHTNSNHKAILFSGFPSSLCPTQSFQSFDKNISRLASLLIGQISPPQAFLLHEQPSAISMFQKDVSNFESLSLHPIAAPNGFFINTEKRWGEGALIFIEDSKSMLVNFTNYQNLPSFSKGCTIQEFVNSYYILEKVSPIPFNSKFSVRATGGGYSASVPDINLSAGEVLAMIGYVKKNDTLVPALYSNGSRDREEFQIPIGVGIGGVDVNLVGTYDISYSVPMPMIDEFRLFSVSAHGMNKIANAQVTR